MKRVLSKEECRDILALTTPHSWSYSTSPGRFTQSFINSKKIETIVENNFNRQVITSPLSKILRFTEGDFLPTLSLDYSNTLDQEFTPYRESTSCMIIFLTDNYSNFSYRGKFTKIEEGKGIILNKDSKIKLDKIQSGTAYILFSFLFDFKVEYIL